MERRDFVANVGMAMAIICTGGLAACSKGGSDTTSPPPGPGGNARLTANLDSELQNTGDFKIAGNVIVIRIAAGNAPASFAALSSTCTHQGCTVSTYNKTSGHIECNAPCGHGSRFTTAGAVAQGPATSALSKFTVAVSGNTLTVT